jgi:S1-C subfamily serine protease
MNDPELTVPESRKDRIRTFLKKIKHAGSFAVGVAAALTTLVVYNFFTPKSHIPTTGEINNLVAQAMGSATPAPALSEQAYKSIQPALVLIEVKGKNPNNTATNGLGSGVIVDTFGDILTSLHVVDGASEIKLFFADGNTSSAQILDKQPEHDIAVLRADQPPEQLVPAVLGDPNSVQIGDEAFVVGNPFGLYSSMSTGVVSGLDRSFMPPNGKARMTGLIQFDAAVNPGNSGGPLMNRNGEVIGIVTGLVNPTGQDVFIGIGFAVPINTASGALGAPQY